MDGNRIASILGMNGSRRPDSCRGTAGRVSAEGVSRDVCKTYGLFTAMQSGRWREPGCKELLAMTRAQGAHEARQDVSNPSSFTAPANALADFSGIVEDPRSAWSPTARAIVDAARALLTEKGYRGISYAAVAQAAGVDKSTISYNFVNKAGLVTAVVDSLIHDECLAILRESQDLVGEDRTRHVVAGISRIVLAADAQKGWFDVYPHAVREEELKARLRVLYAWWFHVNLEWLGVHPGTAESARLAQGLTAVIAAITDGLAIQVGLGMEADMDATLDVLETMVEAALGAIQKTESSALKSS
jgi:AcrR family transcriptional regulator